MFGISKKFHPFWFYDIRPKIEAFKVLEKRTERSFLTFFHKMRCVFPMGIRSQFRTGQCRDDDRYTNQCGILTRWPSRRCTPRYRSFWKLLLDPCLQKWSIKMSHFFILINQKYFFYKPWTFVCLFNKNALSQNGKFLFWEIILKNDEKYLFVQMVL